MLNPFADVQWKPDTKEIKSFGRVLVIGGISLTALFWGLKFGLEKSFLPDFLHFLFEGIILAGVLSYIIPILGRPLYYVWYFIACCIGFVISNLVMGIFYYVILSLFGCALRMRKTDPLRISKPNIKTNWLDAKKDLPLKSYYRQS